MRLLPSVPCVSTRASIYRARQGLPKRKLPQSPRQAVCRRRKRSSDAECCGVVLILCHWVCCAVRAPRVELDQSRRDARNEQAGSLSAMLRAPQNSQVGGGEHCEGAGRRRVDPSVGPPVGGPGLLQGRGSRATRGAYGGVGLWAARQLRRAPPLSVAHRRTTMVHATRAPLNETFIFVF